MESIKIGNIIVSKKLLDRELLDRYCQYQDFFVDMIVKTAKRERYSGKLLLFNVGVFRFKNGLLDSRPFGKPAVSNVISKSWYKCGKLHREDGPARIWWDGKKEFWKEGERAW